MVVGCMNNYYPERLKKVFVVNQPWTLTMLYSVVEPLLDPVTRKKITFVKKHEMLKDHFPAEYLPAEFGGAHSAEHDPLTLGLETLVAG